MDDLFPDNYDLTEVYEKQLLPLIKTIMNICDEHDMPLLIAVQQGMNLQEVDVMVSGVLPEDRSCQEMVEAAHILSFTD